MGDGGLKLWENGALTLISSFRPVLDHKIPKIQKQIRKYMEKLPINRPSGCYVMEDPTMEDPSLLSALGWVYGRSEGFARTAYFVPGCDGMGVWPNSEIVLPPAPPSFTKME